MHKIEPIPFTKVGYAQIEKEHAELTAKRPEAVEELRKAREMGDLSENGAYKGARLKLSQIDSRLRHLKHLLRYGKIIESAQSGVVEIGCIVVVDDGKETREFSIVGGFESNPLEGKLSHISPLGKVLVGKRVGETVVVDLPRGKTTYTIKEVR